MTLMSADIEGVAAGLPRLYEIVMTLIEVTLGTYLLSRFVGLSCFVVLIPLLLSTVATYFLGTWIAAAFTAWNNSVHIRISKTSRVLGQITSLKMFGLGPLMRDYLQRLRELELDASKKHRYLDCLASIPVVGADLLTPVVVIAAALFWRTFDGKFSAATVFPALSIIVLIKHPLATLLNGYPLITSMLACFRRIEVFFRLSERKEIRMLVTLPTSSRANGGSTGVPIVQFVNAKIAPLGSHTPILSNLNFRLISGSLTVVAGSNGSGKSSLLQSILGETELVSGLIQLGEDLIGFCDQTVWLRNDSIKNNIIGPLEFDSQWFNRVVKSVLLDGDFRYLAGGADYIVGPGGVKLSGGQRHRVARLARTFYARMSLLVLDDVFSSLDRKTVLSILHQLYGENGLMKELNTTTIIATNFAECVDLADQVLRLGGNGQAGVETAFRPAVTREKMLRNLLSSENINSRNEEQRQEGLSGSSTSAQEDSSAERQPLRREKSSGLHSLYIKKIGRVRLIIWSLSMLMSSTGEIGPDIYMRVWIDRHPDDNAYFVGYAAIAVATCFIFAITCSILFGDLTPRAALGLHQHLIATVMRATIGFLSGTDNGDTLNRFGQDMTLLVRNLPHAVMRTFYMFFIAIVNTGVIVAGFSYMVAALPAILIPVYLIQRFYLQTSRQMRLLDIQAKAPLYMHFEETAQGLLHIRAFGWKEINLDQGLAILDESQKAFYYMYCIQVWLGLVLSLLSAMLSGILVAVALFWRDTSSGPAVGLAFLNLMVFSDTIRGLIKAFTGLETSIGALSRLRDFMASTPQETQQSPVELPSSWPMGNIESSSVSASYSYDAHEDSVLRELSVSIDAGQKVGFVGRTGSGKSSFFMAPLGFLKYSGTLKIDGIEVSSISPDELRSRVVTISQDQMKLDASIRVNLCHLH